jgi:hypothetical protein
MATIKRSAEGFGWGLKHDKIDTGAYDVGLVTKNPNEGPGRTATAASVGVRVTNLLNGDASVVLALDGTEIERGPFDANNSKVGDWGQAKLAEDGLITRAQAILDRLNADPSLLCDAIGKA